jgi:hypothetical protein
MARLTDEEFAAKWKLGFADNTMQDITEQTFREFMGDVKDSYANLEALNVRQVKGATYPLPYTDSVSQIPAPYRIVGMLALARVGTSAAAAATLATLPGPVTLQLVANAGGDVAALVDEQPGTTTTVQATWVLVSGSPEQVVDSFPELVIQQADGSPHPYQAGDKLKYLFASGMARLFEVRSYLNLAKNPLPTGLESDPYYRPFAPLTSPSAGPAYTDAQARAAQLARTAPAGVTSITLLAESPTDYGTIASGSFTVNAANAVVGKVVRFAVGAGAGAPAFTNAPSGQPYKPMGSTYASGKAFTYSLLVCVDRIEVIILPD